MTLSPGSRNPYGYGVPAYPTHTLFSHMALLALRDAQHPLSGVAHRHAGMFRVAGIAGCDIQCIPYQVCRQCQAPYRHNQGDNRTCLVCGKEALADFRFKVSDGRRLTRLDVERDYYRNTHLVLGRSAGRYGVDARVQGGPAQQPFPFQVVRHLANMFRDAEKIGGRRRDNFLAFTLGWFSHVVSDALFKGVYPQTVRVNFFGRQYHMAMLPAAEALTMTDISYDFGAHWLTWRDELLDDEADGGALRHLAMGNEARLYDSGYWTPEFGEPDPAIGRVMDAVRPLNRKWFHEMYFTPDYRAATPRLDTASLEGRVHWRFNGRDLGQVRAYAIDTGWYDTFIKGIEVYLRIVNEATHLAKLEARHFERAAVNADSSAAPAWSLWRRIVEERRHEREGDWGSRLRIDPAAQAALIDIGRRRSRIILPRRATNYQRQIATEWRARFVASTAAARGVTIMIGPPAFNADASPLLCREDMLRLKYESGLAAFVKWTAEQNVLHLVGLSDWGDWKLIDWVRRGA